MKTRKRVCNFISFPCNVLSSDIYVVFKGKECQVTNSVYDFWCARTFGIDNASYRLVSAMKKYVLVWKICSLTNSMQKRANSSCHAMLMVGFPVTTEPFRYKYPSKTLENLMHQCATQWTQPDQLPRKIGPILAKLLPHGEIFGKKIISFIWWWGCLTFWFSSIISCFRLTFVILLVASCYGNRIKLRQLWAIKLVKTLPFLR